MSSVQTVATGATAPLVDVQSSADTRRIAIDKVGIKSIRYPIQIRDKTGDTQTTVAELNMYVYLPQHFKGTHMSRFVEILERKKHLDVPAFKALLPEMLERLESRAGQIEMRFTYFVNKTAPVSGVQSLMDYDVTFIGKCEEGITDLQIKVAVPVTSLCPCSKEISQYGAHNQRSHITITARLSEFAEGHNTLWIEDIIRIAEESASCELYGLLKRPDEKYVTEKAYENPKFVEDLVRDVAHRLNLDDRISHYIAEAENFESIHNHSAYALIEKQK
ncbi:GTP cyclohydrolase FolE2 [Turneriella parva]|uniref:GTP cyclohydrolase FolE2 n=1 Tax=Turneriella parva (strain ATCC BAA-1111 / DSM 21527 / NCTC 11395 / H) TaxID=869212 RepID=I4B1W4_TURPD|nr:GTP cyclohydrolase FolE2 [Turneriella parva]AFM11271.1 GTP cyclohydrolase I [Turneriella parva DSM 21527]